MAGRKKKPDSQKLYKESRSKREKPYNYKKVEDRGLVGRENAVVKSFWKEYTMDQVLAMTPEQLDIEIDLSIDRFVERQFKWNKHWNFPNFS